MDMMIVFKITQSISGCPFENFLQSTRVHDIYKYKEKFVILQAIGII